MLAPLRTAVSRVIGATPIGLIPVRVRQGPAKGARWTFGPFSAYWRLGGAEADVAAALARLPTIKGIAFWDIGAHYGIHTVGVAMQAGSSGHVAAFEPDPGAFARLSRHVTMNKLTNVKLFQAAVSETSGAITLYTPGRLGSANSHIRHNPQDDMSATPSVIVKTVALDELVASGQIRKPNIIKVDVQGHGHKALRGAARTIADSLPIIAFSNHSDMERDGTRALLEPLGYRPVNLSGEPIKWSAIKEALLLPLS